MKKITNLLLSIFIYTFLDEIYEPNYRTKEKSTNRGEKRTNNTYMGKFAITKERGKNNTCSNQKGSTSTACDDKTMQKTQQSCAWKSYFLKIIIYKNYNNHSINGVL